MLRYASAMNHDAFYIRQDPRPLTSTGTGTVVSTLTPTPAVAGPWDSGLQHGGPVAALLATEMELLAPRPGLRLGQLALDFLSPVPVRPLQVATQIVRPGKKIELRSALLSAEEAPNNAARPVARAAAWFLLTAPDRSPAVHLSEPPPPRPDREITELFPSLPRFGYGESLEWRFTSGGFDAPGPATVWTRLRVRLVRDEPVQPLIHALALVDSANGISAELDPARYLFVPVNLTVSIARLPVGPWVGMSARTELASEGAGIVHARLFDDSGYFGQAMQTLFVEPRK